MFDNPRHIQQTAALGVSYDEGLRRHFSKVYSTMSVGLMVTGGVAFAVSSSQSLVALLFGTPLVYLVMFAPLLFTMFGFTPDRIMRKSAAELRTLFYAFSAVFGLSMATVFIVFTGADIARAFFITAGTFAAMSIFGYTTRMDLSKMSSFLMMGSIGLLMAMVVNIFMQSSMMHFVISAAGVLVYTLWTAFHTQMLKQTYNVMNGDEANAKSGVLGALSLYIDFMMLFQFILSLMGGNRN